MAIALCLTACFLLLARWFLGISFGDDSFYLWTGEVIHPSDLFGSQDWSPLYSLWFKLVGHFVPNPLARYFASWGILVAAAALLPTFMRIRSAWIYAFAILCVPALTVSPFVGLFAGVILLFGTCIVVRRAWSLPGTLAITCVFCSVVSFCRPEFSAWVYLCAGATLVALTVPHASQRLFGSAQEPAPGRLATSVLVMTVLALSVVTFAVFTRSHSTRSGLAFAQHYNRRAADRGLIPQSADVWASDFAEKSFHIDLGHNAANGTASIGEFLRANPRLFLLHVLSNLIDPRTLLLVCIALGLVGWPWLSDHQTKLRPAGLWIGLLCVPPIAGMTVIYPRDHYTMIMLPSLLLYAVQLLRPERWIRPSVFWAVVMGTSLLCFLNLGLPRLRHAPANMERMNLLRVECIRSADQTADPTNTNVFDTSWMTGVYLTHPRTVTHPSDLADWPHFAAWVSTTRPAWISLEPYSDASYKQSPAEVEDLLIRKLGYTAHPCNGNAFLTLYTRDTR